VHIDRKLPSYLIVVGLVLTLVCNLYLGYEALKTLPSQLHFITLITICLGLTIKSADQHLTLNP
jgi:uncharacterized membrane protein